MFLFTSRRSESLSTVVAHKLDNDLPQAENLLAFGYQNTRKLAHMRESDRENRPICIDSNHKTIQYDFYLFSFVMADQYRRGYLVAFIICNYADKKALTCTFRSQKMKHPDLYFQMYDGMQRTHFLCLRHTDSPFRLNLKLKLCNIHVHKMLYNMLRSMIYTNNV